MHTEGYEDYRPYVRDHSQPHSVTSEEVERRIPGTNLTQTELEQKVGAQIDAHKYDLQEHEVSIQRKR